MILTDPSWSLQDGLVGKSWKPVCVNPNRNILKGYNQAIFGVGVFLRCVRVACGGVLQKWAQSVVQHTHQMSLHT